MGRGGARGRRHPRLPPSPCPAPDVQLTAGPPCAGAWTSGRPGSPRQLLFPTWILQRRVSCRSRVPCVLQLSTRSARLSSLPPRPPPPSAGFCFPPTPPEAWRGDPPTCLLKTPGCPEAGRGRSWRGLSRQCLWGLGVPSGNLYLPVGFTSGPLTTLQEAGGAAGAPGAGGATLAPPAGAILGQWRAGGAGGSSLVRVPPSSSFPTLPLVRACRGPE